MKKTLTTIAASIFALIGTSGLHAAGFSLYGESAGYVIGNYAAGVAAEAADASTGWYNPAGLSLIHEEQLVASGIGIFPKSPLSGRATFRSLSGVPAPFATYQQSFSNLDGAENAFVPSVHYVYPIANNLGLGISVVSPFGLSTRYNNASPLRYAATVTDLVTTVVSPELGYRLNTHLALGAGLDLQFSHVKFNTMLGAPTLASLFGLPATYLDSESYNKGNAFGVGYHLGLMLLFNEDHTRIGLNYQARNAQTFHGYSRLTGRLAASGLNLGNPSTILAASPASIYWSNDLYSNDITFPDILTLSAYHDLNDKIALMGSVVYTGWHSFSNVGLNNVAAFASPNLGQVKVAAVTAENYRDAWRIAVGANYLFNDKLMIRCGAGYDKTPTNGVDRDIRLPDVNRYALAIGARYQIHPLADLDVGYSHLFGSPSARVNKTSVVGTSAISVQASGSLSADLIGLQLTWYVDGRQPAAVLMKD